MAKLDASGFTFTSPPTKAETEQFEYVAFDYFENNPGVSGGEYISLIGIYFNDLGQKTA